MSTLMALRFQVLAIALALAACSGAEEPLRQTAANHVAGPHRPDRALSYEPGLGTTDQLIAQALAAVDASPDAIRPYTGLATLFLRRQAETGDPLYLRLADDALQAALSRDADDRMAQTLEVLLLTHDHRFTVARDRARTLAESGVEDPTPWLLLGDAELELGRIDEAAEAYQSAMDLRPDLRSYNRGAYLRWLSDDSDGAIDLLSEALQAGSVRDPASSAWCWTDLARVHWSAGHLAEASRAAESALTLLPNYPEGLRWRARIAVARGENEVAIRTLESLVENHPSVGDELALAELLRESGRSDAAARYERDALAHRREDPRAIALHDARHRRNTAAAVTLAEREVASRPNLWSYDVLALSLARAGRAREAHTAMDRALEFGTPDPLLYLHAAIVELEAGNTEAAQARFGTANELNPRADAVLQDELRTRLGAS